ncbi:type 1 glutamine amidotransferase [Ornithinimicrobium faecis]|uniref:Lipid II isoglutaminyl synthase (glutamine-hydrolyzing) subunit GatD n=1 Tax=Ornithinimicrobium faecis TaxID=2934158 RepID=A0ABY4YQ31_9MICO|nr:MULTISPECIES: cobalamin biosynthesis protein CobB [unclassified Ornithinimicrobium]USQ78809.1 cobalamin biosynthesis protein CobB [Ornithinimicrobium sp. HY1793]
MSDPSQAGAVTASKGTIHLVHLYPREMSIYGDLGNTRALASRLRWHGYTPVVHDHHPGAPWPHEAHLLVGGGGQDSGQLRVQDDLATHADRLRALAADGLPMLMICGMYQLLGRAFITAEGHRLPGLGILDVTTTGNATRMIGPVVLQTPVGEIVGYENHSGSTVLGEGQEPFGQVRHGQGNNGSDGTEGARTGNVIGSYLHGPILPANPALADHLLEIAVVRATGAWDPEDVDDTIAHQAHDRQVRSLLSA